MKHLIAATLACGLLAIGVQAQTPTDTTKPSKTAPTADQAKNNTNDRATMQKIRKAVMADKTLSTSAHNVKIIAQQGKVTLKGPVQSEAEKSTIEQKATEVAGAGNVVDELTIKPAKSK